MLKPFRTDLARRTARRPRQGLDVAHVVKGRLLQRVLAMASVVVCSSLLLRCRLRAPHAMSCCAAVWTLHRLRTPGAGEPSRGYRGVSWDPVAREWRAKACVNGATTYLGRHTVAEEAAAAYDDFIRSCCTGSDVVHRLNFPSVSEASLALSSAPRSTGNGSRNWQIEAASKEIIECGLAGSGLELEWMPEGTRADGAVRPKAASSDDSWVGLQLKATTGPRPNGAHAFHRTSQLDGLLVICIALDSRLLWVLPGAEVKVSAL